jgi:predicted DNA-binding transcriptional regulator AlpA
MQVTKEVVSVSEMARMLGLSRARFYQLMKEGIFPPPTRPGNGGRPFFNREQQEQCIEVRRTNRGVNGQTILFYAMRPQSPAPLSPPRRQGSRRSVPQRPRRSTGDATITELRHGLMQLGVSQISEQVVRRALAETYPDGWSQVDQAELLRSVFTRLNCQDSGDMES